MNQSPNFTGPPEFPVHNPKYSDFPDFEGSQPWDVGPLQHLLRDTRGAPFQSEPSSLSTLLQTLKDFYQQAKNLPLPRLEVSEPQWWTELKAQAEAKRR